MKLKVKVRRRHLSYNVGYNTLFEIMIKNKKKKVSDNLEVLIRVRRH